MDGLIIILLGVLVGIIFGIISGLIYNKKGYRGGFWWGFFFGIFGVIIVCCIPKKGIIESDKSKTNETILINDKDFNEAEEIKKFKRLLDDGVLTEEEFSAKKKQILGI